MIRKGSKGNTRGSSSPTMCGSHATEMRRFTLRRECSSLIPRTGVPRLVPSRRADGRTEASGVGSGHVPRCGTVVSPNDADRRVLQSDGAHPAGTAYSCASSSINRLRSRTGFEGLVLIDCPKRVAVIVVLSHAIRMLSLAGRTATAGSVAAKRVRRGSAIDLTRPAYRCRNARPVRAGLP
jgi:hypothetical protein